MILLIFSKTIGTITITEQNLFDENCTFCVKIIFSWLFLKILGNFYLPPPPATKFNFLSEFTLKVEIIMYNKT